MHVCNLVFTAFKFTKVLATVLACAPLSSDVPNIQLIFDIRHNGVVYSIH